MTFLLQDMAMFGSKRPVSLVLWGLPISCAAASLAYGGEPNHLRTRLAWQIALDRIGFSPGLIDGKIGPKTELATREFQRVRALPLTGRLDAPTIAALEIDPDGSVTHYTVPADDLAQIGIVPQDWEGKSRQARLAYESLSAVVAERFHCTRSLLGDLNPGVMLDSLRPGDVMIVPNVRPAAEAVRGESVEIDLRAKLIRVLDRQKRLIGLFHCSVAAEKAHLPSGETRVAVITENPTYLFDPKMWPEVKGVDRKLLIPPGPRNPVGLCWIGLGLAGYGIHGTPNPELIGKTGSHGCVRLTNWDALRLSKMIAVGTRVCFVAKCTTPVLPFHTITSPNK